jgi:hypothetical protein
MARADALDVVPAEAIAGVMVEGWT